MKKLKHLEVEEILCEFIDRIWDKLVTNEYDYTKSKISKLYADVKDSNYNGAYSFYYCTDSDEPNLYTNITKTDFLKEEYEIDLPKYIIRVCEKNSSINFNPSEMVFICVSKSVYDRGEYDSSEKMKSLIYEDNDAQFFKLCDLHISRLNDIIYTINQIVKDKLDDPYTKEQYNMLDLMMNVNKEGRNV